MGNRREYLIKAIVEICQKLDKKGWVASHDGNVTVRFEENLLATPTAVSKADIVPEMVLVLDMEGNKLQGIGKPFSEIKLHLAAYRAREDINAVVHAHPPFAMARGLVGGDFEIFVPEAIVSIGDVIPVARYAIPGAKEHDEIVTEALSKCDVFMMAGNGVLSVGRDVKEAYLRMELLEHLLKIDYYAKSMGTIMAIPEADKQKLLEKRAAIGLGPKKVNIPSAAAPPKKEDQTQTQPQVQTDVIKDLIAQELKKILQEK
ncbi:MAG: class II aldolase/adducin family protein [Candidatus Aminicenantes bacterium]|nr:class II aldolase/adducin family protein [Candidatus Aminicenantes bacterium]NIM81592.1 class II aldolase/adducin family protein [Candidatus Aminicenantes bacterium]NIN20963.1 class II aldolase/adducin family protein [Candidatus Aminicenantes bacterium]NIN44784.1 class II aldolase/adducin family protein [Candidatus Aminicenantes bacterium]NIN87592.1 class II aldolase/adducin family protein [Candidatus Aminicenantes bacterium]